MPRTEPKPKSSPPPKAKPSRGGIGTMGERSLHAAMKAWYAEPGDRFEVEVDGYHVDIVRDDLLIEIQTRNFSAAKRKLADLTERHRVRLVHPIAQEKWIARLASGGLTTLSRRKSPKRGDVLDLFDELVSVADLVPRATFEVEAVLIQEEEIRRKHTRGRWRRRGWGTHDRRLLDVLERARFASVEDYRRRLPERLPHPFTTADLAKGLDRPRWMAQKIAYCLRKMAAVETVGKRGNALLYEMG